MKVAGVDGDRSMVGTSVYMRLDQCPSQLEAVKRAVGAYLESVGNADVAGLGVTGSGRELVALLLGADLIRTEIFAHAAGLNYLLRSGHVPGVTSARALIEIGGQDSKLITFDDEGMPAYFNMNTICSAGTGEFLKQLGDEAGIALDELGRIALESPAPAVIDATCTVFSKRDFRHLTQKGVPLADRLMGACLALVRNYMQNVARSTQLLPPVFFQGGVAANEAVRQGFQRYLGTEVHVTPYAGVVGAIGMAVSAHETMADACGQARATADGEVGSQSSRFRHDYAERQFRSRVRHCHGCGNGCALAQAFEVADGEELVIDTLGGRCDGCRNPDNVRKEPVSRAFVLHAAFTRPRGEAWQGRGRGGARDRGQPRRLPDLVYSGTRPVRPSEARLFAGIDGGSRGTKWALLESRGPDVKVLGTGAVDTAGDAIAALMQALRELKAAIPLGRELSGVGTTGSAGELFRDIITARSRDTSDVRCTEIVAHYVWASHWKPDVGTIIDIGGNDAKLILVGDSGLDFAMNDKCAAGTGSFIEAVARRFGVSLEEFAREAEAAAEPAQVAGRCAVFGESDIVHKSRLGYDRGELFMGLCHAVCRTFLSDLGRGRTLATPIVAQGGAFLIEPLQTVFRKVLGLSDDDFVVSEDPAQVLCAGALGAALVARGRWEQGFDSAFKGFDAVLSSSYSTVTTVCTQAGCHRRCDRVVALLENGTVLAGYRSVDCSFAHFSGLAEDPAQRRHIQAMLKGSACG